ncbi:hypothetical protein ACFVUS_12655 [Nocardia sp. NPDC058058]|uniref:hypothetical protein n=1 Tax=Nocardia sp. NPDC058058 TaxID=3346317 RepID=UPI0036D79596
MSTPLYVHVSREPSKRFPWHQVRAKKRWLYKGKRAWWLETKCGIALLIWSEVRAVPEEPNQLRCKECWK